MTCSRYLGVLGHLRLLLQLQGRLLGQFPGPSWQTEVPIQNMQTVSYALTHPRTEPLGSLEIRSCQFVPWYIPQKHISDASHTQSPHDPIPSLLFSCLSPLRPTQQRSIAMWQQHLA